MKIIVKSTYNSLQCVPEMYFILITAALSGPTGGKCKEFIFILNFNISEHFTNVV